MTAMNLTSAGYGLVLGSGAGAVIFPLFGIGPVCAMLAGAVIGLFGGVIIGRGSAGS